MTSARRRESTVDPRRMKLGLETFSYHLAFSAGVMDVFSFIDRAAELGMEGVQLNATRRPG